jgi:hypothetical protein
MGSFATSIHVKANDAAAVADTLRHLLFAEGYEATDEEPPDGSRTWLPSPIRAIHVSTPQEGWVSLLDNEGMASQTLTVALSGRLHTHAIHFFVNDSDSWHYQLHFDGHTIDEFNSRTDDDEFDEDDEESAHVVDMGATVNIADAQRLIQERALQWQQQLQERMPPHLREIQQKLRTTGRIAPEEVQELKAWMQSQMPNMREQLRELTGLAGSLSGRLPRQAAPPADTGRHKTHLEHLRSLLRKNVSDSHVVEILSEEATFAEETLGRFLPLIGIPAFYAYLSYQYLAEFTSADLAQESIHFVEHLRFKKPSGRGTGGLRLIR